MSFVKKAVKKVGKFLTSGVLGMVIGKKKSAAGFQSAGPGPVARDEGEELAEREDEIRRRRGAAADMILGTGGADRGGGAKFVAGN